MGSLDTELLRERPIPDDGLFGIDHGFDFGDWRTLSILCLQQFGCLLDPIRFRNVKKQPWFQQIDARVGREHLDLAFSRLIAKPGSWSEKDKRQDADYDHIVLPTAPLVFPEDEALDAVHTRQFTIVYALPDEHRLRLRILLFPTALDQVWRL